MMRRIRVVAGMIEQQGLYLITQRRPQATLPLLWEFPGGRVESGERDEAALARELEEEMGIIVAVDDQVLEVEHVYPDYEVEFLVYRARIVSGVIRHIKVHDHRWVTASELDEYEFPGADSRSMDLLIKGDRGDA
jgi:8-oxo-dGTP diphosphatase